MSFPDSVGSIDRDKGCGLPGDVSRCRFSLQMTYRQLEVPRPEIRGRAHGHPWPPYDPLRSGHRNGRPSQAVDRAKDRGNNQLGVTANREVIAGETYKLDAKVIELTGTDSITLTVGQSSIKIDDEGITLVSADGQRIKLN
jgi:hypothetical protein